ncbi:MAG TPA: zf-HC2 domain-containing protein [Myxococcales bacterium]|nr:zf-HC2 domain-containing protein [Myxococcales bacterium]
MTNRCAEVVPLLGALTDGAIAESDRTWVQAHLSTCAVCPDRLSLLRAQGDALRELMTARGASISFDGFADKVLARSRAAKPRRFEATPIWAREMLGAHRGAFAGAAGLALAACMALAVVFSPQQQAGEELADNGGQVEEVDFGTHDGAVLQLPHETTVIWMSDDRGAVN